MPEREEALKILLKKCSKKYNDKNISKIPYNCLDRGNENSNIKEYSMCYNKNIPKLKDFCGPDWVFYHWPSANIYSFEKTKKEIINYSSQKPHTDKIGWYGNLYSPLKDVIEYKTRPLLKKIGDSNPEIFDIIHIPPNSINDKNPNYLSLQNLVIKYKYLLDIGGNGYSGRLKFLLFSKRPILYVDRNYIEYFQDDLKPYKHYIPVKMDLSDLLDQVKWMQNNEKKCEEIANNAFEFAIKNFSEEKLLERIYQVYKNL